MIVGRYAPGQWQAVVTRGGLVVLGAEVPVSLLESVWRQAEAGRGLPAVLEALTGAFGTSLAAIPPFAVVLREDGGVRAVVRGPFELTVETATGAEELSGAAVTTWTERTIAGALRASVVTAEHAAPVEYPVRDGIVLVSAVTVSFDDGTDAVAPTPAPRPARVASDVPVASEAPEASDVPDVSAGSDEPVVPEAASVPEAPLVPEVQAVPEAPVVPEVPSVPETPVVPDVPSAPAVPAASGPAVPVTGDDVPAPREAEPLIDSVTVSTMAGADTLLPADSTFVRTTDDRAPDVAEAPEVTIIRPPDAPASDLGDHDGETISLAQARALRGAVDSDSMPPPLAPPRRPAPGRIRLSTGQEMLLDRTVVIGRRPRSTRVVGTDLPHLVAVESPEQDISRSHLELRVEGDSIVATDLNTTNGTVLHRTGADPVRLHPGEATVVVSGDVLDLGDGVTVTVEETA